MKREKCTCPFCKADITDFVAIYTHRKVIKAVNEGIDPEKRARMNQRSLDSMKAWREKNPKLSMYYAKKASKARTKSSFKKQAESLKKTYMMKSIKFAELLQEAKEKGEEITAELEKELMKKAAEIVREEKRQEKKK